MSYRVILANYIDETTTEWVELDSEETSFETIFRISEIENIASRNDARTKTLAFKGTKSNNQAFGSMFSVNTHAEVIIPNKLFFNYNPLRTVDCIIMEDAVKILKGSMRVQEVSVDKDGNITYQTVVTGSVTDLIQLIKDKQLSDLDLSDLQHRMTLQNIKDTWSLQTEQWDGTQYVKKPFKLGSSYVYPFIDYGHRFTNLTLANAHNNNPLVHNIENFRPAIYAKEYLDRIFKQIPNYSYEVKGSPEFKKKFDALIIPNNQEKVASKTGRMNFKVWKASVAPQFQAQGSPPWWWDNGFKTFTHGIAMQAGLKTPTSENLVNHYGNYRSITQSVFNVDKTFVGEGKVKVEFAYVTNNRTYMPVDYYIQLVERDFRDAANQSNFDGTEWDVLASGKFTVPAGATLTNQVVEFNTGEQRISKGKQIMIRLMAEGRERFFFPGQPMVANQEYKITICELSFPLDQANGELLIDAVLDDTVYPKPPDNIKQVDFIKSLTALFNLYVYPDKVDSRKLIFESYDQFYRFTHPSIIREHALDWSPKLALDRGFKLKSNITIPKKYLFTFKSDTDYINKDYADNYGKGEVYGSWNFSDALGITDTKKVEVIFAATPNVEYNDSKRQHPAIFQYDRTKPINAAYQPMKSVIRAVFYNGMKSCQTYNIAGQVFTYSAGWQAKTYEILSSYPNCSEFYLDSSTNQHVPVACLNFASTKHRYFASSDAYENCPHLYYEYYLEQTTQLTNENVVYVDAEVMLNEIDITNLDLSKPVFIDIGDGFGHAYYRVLSVSYTSQELPSQVSLQKIIIPYPKV